MPSAENGSKREEIQGPTSDRAPRKSPDGVGVPATAPLPTQNIFENASISVLDLKPGDVLVLKTEMAVATLQSVWSDRVVDTLRKRFPGVQVLMLTKGQDLSILRASE